MNELHSWLKEYIDQVKCGNIIAGRRIKQVLSMFEENFNDAEIQFDLEDAAKHIRFIESECKLYEAPFAGKPFVMELFQKAIIESIFAFKIYSAEANRFIRKYQDVLLVMGRKNGKSPFTAAILLSEWFCGEMGTKVLIGSNDYEQANIMFSACDAMREESHKLDRCTRRTNKGIFFGNRRQKKRHGKFTMQNKGSICKISAKGSNKEGRNIKIGAIDEVHEMADNHLVMPIRQALSTQEEPLYFEITTEGFVDDGYLDGRLADATKMLDGEMERSDFLVWWFAQDSEQEVWQDESSWIKSNPGIGKIKKFSFLRKMVEEAKTNTSTRAFVLAKDFNIKQNSAVAWLDIGTIINTNTFDLHDFEGGFYIGGLDFAETTDLCSARAMFIRDGRKYTASMYFVPESKADANLDDENPQNPEHKDYHKWAEQGLVTICPGAEVSARMVADWFIGLFDTYNVRPFKLGFDNWHAKDFKQIIVEYFGDDVPERIGMDFNSLSGAMRSMESDLKSKNLNYNNNPIDAWCLKNMSVKLNNVGLIMPVKKYGESKNRIDGGLSNIICYATYSRFRSQFADVQEMG